MMRMMRAGTRAGTMTMAMTIDNGDTQIGLLGI